MQRVSDRNVKEPLVWPGDGPSVSVSISTPMWPLPRSGTSGRKGSGNALVAAGQWATKLGGSGGAAADNNAVVVVVVAAISTKVDIGPINLDYVPRSAAAHTVPRPRARDARPNKNGR